MQKYIGSRKAIFKGLIILLSFILYSATIGFDFVLDDTIVIVENNFVKKGIAGIPDILLSEGFEGYFGEQKELVAGARYRPLSLVMFALEYSLVGAQPWLGHLINILLYGFLGWLIFSLSQYIIPEGKNEEWMTFGFVWALLFIIHPIHTEVVCNIKGRDEILALLFSLWSIKAGLEYSRKGSIKHMILVGVLYFLALLGKENALPMIVIIPLSMLLFSEYNRKKVLSVILVLTGTVVLYLMLRFVAVGYLLPKEIVISGDLMNNPFVEMTSSQRYATISNTLVQYLRLFFFPYPLTHDYYPYQVPITNWSSVVAWIGLLSHIALGVFSLICIKKYKVISWGILFYLGTLFLVSNIPFPIGTLMNERFLFIPSLGFCAIAAFYLVKWFHASANSWIPMICIGGIASLLILGTLTRVPDWENGQTLNMAASKVSTQSARMNLFVGTDYYKAAMALKESKQKLETLGTSKKYMERALEIYPDYGAAYNMKAGVCAEVFNVNKNIRNLMACFTEVASAQPNTRFVQEYLVYLDGFGTYKNDLFNFYINVGYNNLLKKSNDYPQAILYLRRAEKISPSKEVLIMLVEGYDLLEQQLRKRPSKKFKLPEVVAAKNEIIARIQKME